MNLKLFSIVCALTTLSGCSSTRSTDPEFAIAQSESFEDHNLALLEPDENNSTAMQYAHLLTRERVHKANDLDTYMDGYSNVSARSTQGLAAAGVITGSLNPFQAAFSMIGQESNLSKLSYKYRYNTLFIITPLPSLEIEGVTMVINESRDKLVDILRDTYRKDGSSLSAINSQDANWLTRPISYLIPIDKKGDVANCYDPELLKKIESAVAKEDYNARSVMPVNGTQWCFASINNFSKVYTSDDINGAGLPAGNFIVTSLSIPSIFPIDKLSSTESGVYLYQPSFRFFKDKNLSNHLKSGKLDDLGKYFKEDGMFRIAPRVTNLSNDEVLEFGFVN